MTMDIAGLQIALPPGLPVVLTTPSLAAVLSEMLSSKEVEAGTRYDFWLVQIWINSGQRILIPAPGEMPCVFLTHESLPSIALEHIPARVARARVVVSRPSVATPLPDRAHARAQLHVPPER